jgi:hypothetical protein
MLKELEPSEELFTWIFGSSMRHNCKVSTLSLSTHPCMCIAHIISTELFIPCLAGSRMWQSNAPPPPLLGGWGGVYYSMWNSVPPQLKQGGWGLDIWEARVAKSGPSMKQCKNSSLVYKCHVSPQLKIKECEFWWMWWPEMWIFKINPKISLASVRVLCNLLTKMRWIELHV